jgi:hypothetical protein
VGDVRPLDYFQSTETAAGGRATFGRRAVIMATTGLLLPYFVGVLGGVLFQSEIRSMAYYRSGRLTRLDHDTELATFAAVFVGVCLMLPFLFRAFRGSNVPGKIWLALLLCVHLAAVFVVRFIAYYMVGGIL